MTRRSVSLPPALERNVRLLQANLLTALDRDVSFTQALNAALATAFAVPGLAGAVDQSRWRGLVAEASAEDGGSLADVPATVFETIGGLGVPSAASSDQRPQSKSYAGSEMPAPAIREAEVLHEPIREPYHAPAITKEAPPREAQPVVVDASRERTPVNVGVPGSTGVIETSPSSTTGPTPEQPTPPPTPVALDPGSRSQRADHIREARTEIQRLMSNAGDTPSQPAVQVAEPIETSKPAEPTPSREAPSGPTVVEHQRSASVERPAPSGQQPRVMTAADLDKLRRAVLGHDPAAMEEPASKEPPSSPRPTISASPGAPREPAARSSDDAAHDRWPRAASKGWEMAPPPRKPAPTTNPDYPGIDPSQWEPIEDSKEPAPKALSYDDLSQTLDDAAANWRKEMRKGKDW